MVTLKDIAERAGVSYASVSYILNGKKMSLTFKEETRERVKQIAREMGYQSNEIARTMVTGHSQVIGYIARDTDREYSGQILTGALKETDQHGYSLRLFHLANKNDLENIAKSCIQQRLAGVICYTLLKEEIEYLRACLLPKGIAVAIVSNSPFCGAGVHVYCDGREGGRLAFEYLYNLGHRRIAHIAPYKDEIWSSDRREGFIQAAKEAGLEMPERFILTSPKQLKELFEQLKALYKDDNGPTAIFCNSDFAANDTILILAKLGLSVPENVSIVGYGDFSLSKSMITSLTTIREPFAFMGKKVTQILIDSFAAKGNKKIDEEIIEKIKVELIPRESTMQI